MRGRNPQPAAIKEAKGNPGKRPIAKETDIRDLAKGAPNWLTDKAALAIWAELHGELTRIKLLRATDANAFARYCRNVAHWIAVTKVLAEEGDTYVTETKHGTMRRINPSFIIQERIERRLVDAEDRLGLNPAARQRILQQMASSAQQLQLPIEGSEAGKGNDAPRRPPSPVGLFQTGTDTVN